MLLRFSFLIAWCGPLIFTSCQTSPVAGGGAYHVTAYKPHDPSKVVVKVSLSKENIYVMEGDRCLMAVACSVGIPAKPTPRGHFTIYRKEEDKRSGSYGFRVQGDRVVPAEAGSNVPGRYVGYPMGFWCEFAPAYGFHQGFVTRLRERMAAFVCMAKRRRNFMHWFVWARLSPSPRRNRKTLRLVRRCSGWMIHAHRTRIPTFRLVQQHFRNRVARFS
jgi:L,D-transpeptidase catalytic domain.